MSLKKIILAEDPLSPESWETQEVENICEFLAGRFPEFPETARIYHGEVSEETDVTPSNEAEIQNLQNLDGTFYVVIYAAAPVLIPLAISLIFAAISYVMGHCSARDTVAASIRIVKLAIDRIFTGFFNSQITIKSIFCVS